MVEDVKEEFILAPEGEEVSAGDTPKTRRSWFVPFAAALAVVLFVGGAYAFGKYAGGGSPSFLANISSLFRETFSNEGRLVETIPLRGGGEIAPAVTAGTEAGDGAGTSLGVRGASVPACTAAGSPSRAVLLNEVAWAGTASDATSHEWIELMNPGSAAVPLAGWQLVNKSGGIRVAFGSRAAIEGEGYLLLERKDDGAVSGVAADVFFQNAIRNSDEVLQLFDARCNLVDEVKADAGSGRRWPAGEASPGYRSAERAPDLTWHTYGGNGTNGVFGTPKAENSVPVVRPVPVIQTQLPATSSAITTSSTAAQDQMPVPSVASAASMVRVIISEVMVGMDGRADCEFVELYNADDHAVDLTGWSVKRRTSTGSESALVAASRLDGTMVPAGHYFLLANDGGYMGAVAADVRWPKSYTLAYANNAVIVYNAAGEKSDEVSWSEIPKGSSYARVPIGGSVFSVQAVPTPQNAAGL